MKQDTRALLGDDLTEVPGPSLSLLAAQAERLLKEDDCNPLDEDCVFRRDFLRHLDVAVLEDLADLVAADRILDLMYTPSLRSGRSYALLQGKARAFIERFPQLLCMGWVHADGCVSDLIEDIRLQRESHRLSVH